MFKILCSDINIFKASFEAVCKIVNEVQMEIDSDGIRLNAIDPSHVTFVHLNIDEYEFDRYECAKPLKICFDTNEFLKYLKRIGKDSLMELSADANYLIIRAEGTTNETFKLKLIEIDDSIPPIPTIEYPNTFKVPTTLFKEIIKDISEFSQKIKITNKENDIKFIAYGDFADAEIQYTSTDTVNDNLPENCSAVYDVVKIEPMLKADKFAKTTSISWGNDMPIFIEMKSENEKQELSFLLAPRIEVE